MSNFARRENCPACLHGVSHTLYSREYLSAEVWPILLRDYGTRVKESDFAGVHYTLLECHNCRTVYQQNIPGAPILKRIYGEQGISDVTDDQYTIDRHLEYSREILTIIDFFKAAPNDLKFLDFGMGFSRWARLARTIGCQSYGVEYVEEYREIARKYGVIVLEEGQLSAHRFHFINTEQVFEHLDKPADIISTLAEALEPGGILKISVPWAANIRKRIQKMNWQAPKFSRYSLNPVAPLEHIQCFNHRSLDLMAQKVGLERIQIPLFTQYKYINNFSSLKMGLKSLLLPFMVNFFPSRNYAFFRKKS